jgi:hypothetical protein
VDTKRGLVALGAACCASVIAFCGSSTSTGFSSVSPIFKVGAHGATMAPVVLLHGDISATGLLPGAPPDVISPSPSVANNNKFRTTVTITFKTFVFVQHGRFRRAPNPDDLLFGIDNGSLVSASHLQDRSFELGTLDAHGVRTFQVKIALSSAAGNEWQGAEGFLPYTVTLTQRS